MKVVVTAVEIIEGHDFELTAQLQRELRRADGFITQAVAACHRLLETPAAAGLDHETTGLFIGTAFGPMQTNFDVLEPILDDGQASPTLFSHSVFNAATGYISRIFNLRGNALTITDFGYPFFHALQQAEIYLKAGMLTSCLVLQVETYSKLLADARRRSLPQSTQAWQPQTVAWLLELETDDHSDHFFSLEHLEIESHGADPVHAIQRGETLWRQNHETRLENPASAAVTLTRSLLETHEREHMFSLSGPFGNVRAAFRKNITTAP